MSRLVAVLTVAFFPLSAARPEPAPTADRSPVDFVLTPDGRSLLSVNQESGTLSLVRLADSRVIAEVPVGARPSALALTPDGRRVLVTASYGGELTAWDIAADSLSSAGRLMLGAEPRGVAVTPDGKRAWVALSGVGAVVEVDLGPMAEVRRVPVGQWPRYLTLSLDGSRLAVGVNGDGGVAVVDTVKGQRLWLEDFNGLNLGQTVTSSDGVYAYLPWMVYRQLAITPSNIRNGWVLASRLGRVRLDKPARREAISLDPQGMAVSDPHGVALSPDGNWLYCAASGTHELLVYRLAGLPWKDYGGPGDHIDAKLLADRDRFFRVPLGGRPMAVRVAADGKLVYVANALRNSIQVVDPVTREIVREIALGGPAEPSLARKGEAIFYDGRRSFDQWYSCHSCHYEGHTNAGTMDTLNDGRFGNFKTILSLRNVTRTGPWTWHGWQGDLGDSLRKSLVDSMRGPEPTADDVAALTAYLDTLRPPPNPHRGGDGQLSESARRGEAVFRGAKAQCQRCHGGEYFTDGKVHDVGTGERGDVYKGYNPPSLLGVYDRPRLLHDGRAKSLEATLTGPHDPDALNGRGALTPAELRDLVDYLKSL